MVLYHECYFFFSIWVVLNLGANRDYLQQILSVHSVFYFRLLILQDSTFLFTMLRQVVSLRFFLNNKFIHRHNSSYNFQRLNPVWAYSLKTLYWLIHLRACIRKCYFYSIADLPITQGVVGQVEWINMRSIAVYCKI